MHEVVRDLDEAGEMLRLREGGAEGGDGFVLFILRPGAGGKEADWQVRQGKVKVEPGGLVKYMLSEAGGNWRGCGVFGPKKDILLGRGGMGVRDAGIGGVGGVCRGPG